MSTHASSVTPPAPLLSLSWAPISSAISTTEDFFKYHGDKRVANLKFMDNPWEVMFISLFYVYFSYDLGPHRLMKNRQAFDLVWTVRIFNTFILLLNVWLLSRFFTLLNWGYDIMGCAVSWHHLAQPKIEQLHKPLSRPCGQNCCRPHFKVYLYHHHHHHRY